MAPPSCRAKTAVDLRPQHPPTRLLYWSCHPRPCCSVPGTARAKAAVSARSSRAHLSPRSWASTRRWKRSFPIGIPTEAEDGSTGATSLSMWKRSLTADAQVKWRLEPPAGARKAESTHSVSSERWKSSRVFPHPTGARRRTISAEAQERSAPPRLTTATSPPPSSLSASLATTRNIGQRLRWQVSGDCVLAVGRRTLPGAHCSPRSVSWHWPNRPALRRGRRPLPARRSTSSGPRCPPRQGRPNRATDGSRRRRRSGASRCRSSSQGPAPRSDP